MDEAAVAQYVADTFDGLDVVTAPDATFFFYNPDPSLPPDRTLPFATIVSSDAYDDASDLSRPGVFRLNIGVSPDTYRSLFGPQPTGAEAGDAVEAGRDFTALDQLLPHPVYASMSRVCILNPSDATFQTTVLPLLAEAYDLAVRRYTRRAARYARE